MPNFFCLSIEGGGGMRRGLRRPGPDGLPLLIGAFFSLFFWRVLGKVLKSENGGRVHCLSGNGIDFIRIEWPEGVNGKCCHRLAQLGDLPRHYTDCPLPAHSLSRILTYTERHSMVQATLGSSGQRTGRRSCSRCHSRSTVPRRPATRSRPPNRASTSFF